MSDTRQAPPDQSTKTIVLPQDRPVHLFVMAEAMYFSLLKHFTKTVYELEVANQEINSLSNLPRDVHRARVRDLAARKRHYGALENIPNENILNRPPPWMLAVLIFGGIGLFAYVNYQYPNIIGGISDWWTSYGGYLVVGLILLGVVMFMLMRRGKKKAQ